MVTVRPSKQRSRLFNAPLHARRKLLSAPLSEDLRKKHGIRSLPLRSGDKVKVMRGQYRGTVGKVDRTDTRFMRIFVVGVEVTKRNGAKAPYPIHPSNVMILDAVASDKRRFKRVASQDSQKAKPAKSE